MLHYSIAIKMPFQGLIKVLLSVLNDSLRGLYAESKQLGLIESKDYRV